MSEPKFNIGDRVSMGTCPDIATVTDIEIEADFDYVNIDYLITFDDGGIEWVNESILSKSPSTPGENRV